MGVASLIGGICFLLIVDVGAVALTGLGMMVAVLIVSSKLAAQSKGYSKAMLGAADATVGALREMVDGAKVVKLQSWEPSYRDLIQRRREAELEHLRKIRLVTVVTMGMGRASPILANLVTFVVLFLTTGNFSAAVVLPTMQVFQSLRVPFIVLPMGLPMLVQIGVAAKRIATHLILPDQPPIALLDPSAPEDALLAVESASLGWAKALADEVAAAPPPKEKSGKEEDKKKKKAVVVGKGTLAKSTAVKVEMISTTTTDDASVPAEPSAAAPASAAPASAAPSSAAPSPPASPPPTADAPAATDTAAAEEFTVPLRDVTLSVRRGELVAVAGSVGSGKSTLLAACWGEALVLKGSLRSRVVGGKDVGVMLQRPFIIGGTVLENILMGREHDAARMAAVIREAALEEDLAQLPDGERTHVGERGVTLSGGQQQRVAVARALYGQPLLLLADDPLSAVDARTQSALLATFSAFARGGQGRSILCALNQPHHLAAFDRVVQIDGTGALQEGAPPKRSAIKGDDTIDSLPGVVVSPTIAADAASKPPDEAAKKKPQGSAVSSVATSSTAQKPALGMKESKEDGGFDGSLVTTYLRSMGGHVVATYYVVLACSYAAYITGDMFLTRWIGASRPPEALLANATLAEVQAADAQAAIQYDASLVYLAVYAGCSIVHVLLLVGSSAIWAYGGVRASRSLHSGTIGRLALAPLWWYDATPGGRIMSRFTSDIGVVDMQACTRWGLTHRLDEAHTRLQAPQALLLAPCSLLLCSLLLCSLLLCSLLLAPCSLLLACHGPLLRLVHRSSPLACSALDGGRQLWPDLRHVPLALRGDDGDDARDDTRRAGRDGRLWHCHRRRRPQQPRGAPYLQQHRLADCVLNAGDAKRWPAHPRHGPAAVLYVAPRRVR